MRSLWREFTDRMLDASVVSSFDATGYERHAQAFDPRDLDVDLSGQTVLITGANGGLGMATARGLGQLGAHVVLACRRPDAASAAAQRLRDEVTSGSFETLALDLATRASVDRAREHLPERVDTVILNAGILPPTLQETEDGLETTLAVNLIGHHRLMWWLRPALQAAPSPRVVLVSSGGMYLQKLNVDLLNQRSGRFDGATAYARTKRAQVAVAPRLQAALGDHVHVWSMHPGWADTGGVQRQLPRFHRAMEHRLRTPTQGADTTVWLAARAEAPEPRGAFWFDRAARDPSPLPGTATTADEVERLWAAMCDWADVPETGWTLTPAT